MFQENLFKIALLKKKVSTKELAAELGISESTLYRKIQADGNFNREEINTIIDFLELSTNDFKDIFFAEELA